MPAHAASLKRRGLCYSRDKFQVPSCCAAFSEAFSQLKAPDFSVDVDTHYQWLCDSITKLACVHFPLDKCKPRHPWTSLASLKIVQVRRQVREMTRDDSAVMDSWRLHFAFRHWASSRGFVSVTDTSEGLFAWLRFFHQRQAWSLHLLRHLSQQIKISVGNDKTAYLSRMAAIANNAAENSNTKRFYWAVKRLKKFRPKPLRGVFLENGTLAKSPEEVAARWQRHFSSTLAGSPVALEEISRGHFARTSAPGCTPSQTQLRALLLKSSKAKSPGPDGIVNEVLVAGGESMVRELQRVFFKVCLSNAPPHAMRGGWLVDIFKGKGDPRDCSNSRGVMLEDHVPKLLSKHLRNLLEPHLPKLTGDMQFGARKSRSPDMAALVLRLAASRAKSMGDSFGVLFADLTAAFDSIIREIALGQLWNDDYFCHFLSRLNTPPSEWRALLASFQASGGVARLANLDEQLIDLIAGMHVGTWFSPHGMRDRIVQTFAGVRPGNPMADVLFVVVLGHVLKGVQDELEWAGLLTQLDVHDDVEAWSSCVSSQVSRSVPLSQISYMDDIALPLQASCPLELLEKVTSATEILDRHLISHNLRLNFKPGKTEAVLQLRGPASKEAGQVITSLGSACLQLSNGQMLRVASGYKHLGVFFSSSGSMAVELSKRVASALGAFHDIVQGFLKARNIAVAPKIQVVMATIVSRLLLYAGVWDPLSAAQVRKLNTVYMRALRAAMGKERGPHLNVTDLAVRIEAGVPSISTLVRKARLRLVARVAATDCDALKALTQDPHILAGDFFGEIKRDLVCLYDFDRRLSLLPSPATGLDQWSRFWRTAGRYWKRYVSVLKSPADAKCGDLPSPSVKCDQCGKAFQTSEGLKVHEHRVHGVSRSARQFVESDGICPFCQRCFQTRLRAMDHISYRSRACRNAMEYSDLAPVAPERQVILDKRDAEARCRAKKAGISFLSRAFSY